MGMIQGSTGKALVLTASLIASPGCVPLAEAVWGPRLPAARSVVVDGEIRGVDARRGRIQVRSGRGRTSTMSVDRSTRVVYRRRSYPVDALERGDLVRVWVEVDGRGEAWADRVEVRHSVRERYEDGRGTPRVLRLEGRVHELSLRNGYFTVDQGYDHAVVVYFRGSLDARERRRIERLRPGDRVRADVRLTSGNEAELIRLR